MVAYKYKNLPTMTTKHNTLNDIILSSYISELVFAMVVPKITLQATILVTIYKNINISDQSNATCQYL